MTVELTEEAPRCIVCRADVGQPGDGSVGFKFNGRPRFYACVSHAQMVRDGAGKVQELVFEAGRAAFKSAKDALLARLFPK